MTENKTEKHIMILGIGNTLFADEGFGVRAVEALDAAYVFPENVSLVDGGVLGINLLGFISRADHLIVLDCIRHQGAPGDLYRLTEHDIPDRMRAKNSLHQVDFLEALTLCRGLDKVPQTIIIGVEPHDIETLTPELSPVTKAKIGPVMRMTLRELDRLQAPYEARDPEERYSNDCMSHKDHFIQG